jgi:hypothetical protein
MNVATAVDEHLEYQSTLGSAKHPLKFVKAKTVSLLYLLLFIHIGTLIIVGLYYLSFETIPWVTARWHEIGPEVFGTTAKDWSYVRHLIRDVGEGLLGGYLGQLIVWNHFKGKMRKLRLKQQAHKVKYSALDKFEHALHVPNIKYPERLKAGQFAFAPILGIVYAIPGFAIAVFAVKWAHVHAPAEAATATYGQKVEAIFTGNYDKKIVGLFASLVMGRRPMKKVYDDTQLYFAERRAILGKPVRWYHPPTFKARYYSLKLEGTTAKPLDAYHTGRLATVMSAAVLLGLGLAGFGYYVLTVIA